MKIYGPYFNKKSNRKFVRIQLDNGKIITKTYARYLKELELGYPLDRLEEVDHINEDKSVDELDNLQVISKSENIVKGNKARNASRRTSRKVE